MLDLKIQISKIYVFLKTYQKLRKLFKKTVDFPTSASYVKNVLILLPRKGHLVDAAMIFIRHLRQYYKRWHFMILNVDKITTDKLNKFDLPNRSFISELELNNFQLILNLNFEPDMRMDFLAVMLKIPYRLHVQSSKKDIYNILIQINKDNFKSYHHVFEYLKSSFLLK